VIIAVIPIVGIVAGAVVIFFYLYWRHKIQVLRIQHNVKQENDFDWMSFSLLTGLLLGLVGVALTIFLGIVAGRSFGLLGGIIPLSFGVALLCFYVIRLFQTRRPGN
jgi:hypothetical protein